MKFEDLKYYYHAKANRFIHIVAEINTFDRGKRFLAEELDNQGIPTPRLMEIPAEFETTEWEESSQQDFLAHYDPKSGEYLQPNQAGVLTVENLLEDWIAKLSEISLLSSKKKIQDALEKEITRTKELLIK